MSKALFLDRDGTLILDKVYLADPAGAELLPGVVDGLTLARSRGYKAVPLHQTSPASAAGCTRWRIPCA